MIFGTTWHEFIGGLALLVIIVIVGVLLALASTVPTELWALATTLIGLLFGIQIPKQP